jgi:predicted amidohydrolase
MRTIIVNGTIIPGDGKIILPDHSVVIEDGIILDVINQSALPYDPADEIIDAGRGLVIPGIINHHSHGGVVGPFNCFGELPLPYDRVIYNLNRHLIQGTTTLVNACGWPVMGEVEMANKVHPINIKASTLHSPAHLKHALAVDGKGIKEWHKTMTVDEMFARGAVAVGEVGAPCAAYGVPQITEELGIQLSVHQVERLKQAVLGPGIDPEFYDEQKVMKTLKEIRLEHLMDPNGARDLFERHAVRPYEMIHDCIADFLKASSIHDVPMLFHNTMDTQDEAIALAAKMGDKLIALHCNYTFSTEEALACARELKKHGARVDIFTGDAFGMQMFQKSPDVSFALFKEGLVDLISTDYISGYWDPILVVMQKLFEADLISLPKAVRMMSRSVVEAIPKIGRDRGTIAPGKMADLVITHPKQISQVRWVLIGGRQVVKNGIIMS